LLACLRVLYVQQLVPHHLMLVPHHLPVEVDDMIDFAAAGSDGCASLHYSPVPWHRPELVSHY
jgi:hypothetical protein